MMMPSFAKMPTQVPALLIASIAYSTFPRETEEYRRGWGVDGLFIREAGWEVRQGMVNAERLRKGRVLKSSFSPARINGKIGSLLECG